MTRRQLVAMWGAIALLVATWLYPPWFYTVKHPLGDKNGMKHGIEWSPLFDENHSGLIAYWPLLLEDAIILVLAAGLIISFRKSN